MKLIIVGNPTCRPCVVMKNQIMDRINEVEKIGASFFYVSLNDLEDKDTFIAANDIMCTPTILIKKERETVWRHEGYIDVDTLFDTLIEKMEGK